MTRVNQAKLFQIIELYLSNTFQIEPKKVRFIEVSKDISSRADKYSYLIEEGDRMERLFLKIEIGKNVFELDKEQYARAEKIYLSLHLQHSRIPKTRGFFTTKLGDRELRVLALTPAKGRELYAYFSKGRKPKLDPAEIELAKIGVVSVAKALGELNAVKSLLGFVGETYIDEYRMALQYFLEIMDTLPELFPFSKGFFLERIKLLSSQVLSQPVTVGILHGDFKPQNILYAPEEHIVTFVDIQGICKSVDMLNRPVGPVAFELALLKTEIMKKFFMDNIPLEVTNEILTLLESSYKNEFAQYYPSTNELNFYLLIRWMNKVIWFVSFVLNGRKKDKLDKTTAKKFIDYAVREIALLI